MMELFKFNNSGELGAVIVFAFLIAFATVLLLIDVYGRKQRS